MKNMLIATALAASTFLAMPAAHAADNSGFFINGNIGQSSFDKHGYNDDDTAYGINGGYRWALAPNFLLGVEGGYADLGSFDPELPVAGIGRAELKGWNAGVNAHWNLTDNWYLSGRGGYFRGDLTGGYVSAYDPTTTVYTVTRVDDSSNKWYAGAGFGYDFSNNASIGLNYDYYKATKSGLQINPKVISVSAEYRF